jgi:leucyl aminopeptidase
MKITFAEPRLPSTGTIVVAVAAERKLTADAETFDRQTKGALQRAMKASRFTGKTGQFLDILSPPGIRAERIVLAGMGKLAELDALAIEKIGGGLCAHLNAGGVKEATVIVGLASGKAKLDDAPRQAAHCANGAVLRAYRFDKYRTKDRNNEDAKPSLKALTLLVKGAAAARRHFSTLEKVAEGVFLTRDLVSEPANVIYPETLAQRAKALTKVGVKVETLGIAQMRKLGMNALLGVAQGSAHEPRLLVMQWNGGPRRGRDSAPIAFVGKGVTFDTGGISIKPAGGMEDMKWDMGGAGVVIGLMQALAGRKAAVNAVGICGLVENMPSGTAQRPGDIVTSMSGQTIEVLNTDAEGRLVLADALWYTQQRFKPKAIVDLATLTGAIIVALGNEYAGLFSNDDALAEALSAAGTAVDEKVWRQPLHEAYDKAINSEAADMQNIGSNRAAGSITAAQFLKRFVKDVPWAHLDIAGVTWSKKPSPLAASGATAFGVRLLDRLVAQTYEK